MRTLPRVSIFCMFLMSAGVLPGCSSSRPLPMWQGTVERFVINQSNGDINALSKPTINSSLRMVGAIDDNTDVQGVLMAAPTIEERQWYIYLVGVSKNRQVQDIRMMAISRDPTPERPRADFDWSAGLTNKNATELYRNQRLREWQANQAEPRDAKEFNMIFPAPDDVFTCQIAGNIVTASDSRSGARWTLVVGENVEQIKPEK